MQGKALSQYRQSIFECLALFVHCFEKRCSRSHPFSHSLGPFVVADGYSSARDYYSPRHRYFPKRVCPHCPPGEPSSSGSIRHSMHNFPS
jgi:hypothetical protein